MLRFNARKYYAEWRKMYNLNTSHVKVQPGHCRAKMPVPADLNTSHVKVQPLPMAIVQALWINLNTSHVKVQQYASIQKTK